MSIELTRFQQQQVNPGKFVVLLIPFLVAVFEMPRIMQYEAGDGLGISLLKGNLALSAMMAVTIASIGILILLDIRQRTKRKW